MLSKGRVDLNLMAPPSCPKTEEILSAVTGLDEPDLPRLVARAMVEHVDVGYRLTLVTVQAGQQGRREFSADNCEQIGQTLALLLSLSLVTDELEEHRTEGEIEKMPERAPAPTRSYSVTAGVRGTLGLHPSFSIGPLLGIGYRKRSFSVQTGFGWGPRSVAEQDGQIRGRFESGVATVDGCFVADFALTLGACVGVEAGLMTGRALNVDRSVTAIAPWISPRLSSLVVLQHGRLVFLGRSGLSVSVVRPRFLLDSGDLVFQPAKVSGFLEISSGISF